MAAPPHTQQLLCEIQDTPVGQAFKQWVELKLNRSMEDVVIFGIQPYIAVGKLGPQPTNLLHFAVEFADGAMFVDFFLKDAVAEGKLK